MFAQFVHGIVIVAGTWSDSGNVEGSKIRVSASKNWSRRADSSTQSREKERSRNEP
jgi:hypothetical protein